MKGEDVMNLFYEIKKQINFLKQNKIPISDIAHEKGFKIIDLVEENENFCAELVQENERIVLSIKSFDHSKIFQDRLDTYHNYIYLYRDETIVE